MFKWEGLFVSLYPLQKEKVTFNQRKYYNAYVKLIVIHNAFYYPQSQCAGCEARAYYYTLSML